MAKRNITTSFIEFNEHYTDVPSIKSEDTTSANGIEDVTEESTDADVASEQVADELRIQKMQEEQDSPINSVETSDAEVDATVGHNRPHIARFDSFGEN